LGGKGEYSVSATGKDGGYDYYEAGTELTITALESPIFTFLAWYTNPETGEGYEAANPLTIKMDKDITKYLEFATESYVCGWNFKKATTTNSVPATYLGDYVEEAPIITMYYTYEDRINGHNPFSGWWASKDGENSVTAWKYYTYSGSQTSATEPPRLLGEAYYLETVLNTTHYKDVTLTFGIKSSYYGYDACLVQVKYKEESNWETVATHTISSSYATYRDTIKNTGGKATLYIRIIQDVTATVHGDIKDVDGTSYKDIFILAQPNPAGIDQLIQPLSKVYVTEEGIHIEVNGKQPIQLYTIDGRLVEKKMATESLTIPLTRKGLYLLKTGDQVTKISY
jgi:hypothetical protein